MERFRKFTLPFLLIGVLSIGVSIFIPFVSPYLSGLGFSDSTISFANALGVLGVIAFSPVAGRISDKLGRRLIIILGLILEIFAVYTLLNISKSAILVSLILMIQVTGMIITELILLSDVEEVIRKKKRGLFTGIYESIRSIGMIFGPLAGAYLVAKSGIPSVFKISILIFTLIIFFGLFLTEKSKNIVKPKLKDFNFLNEIKEFWKNKDLRGMGILGFAMHFSTPFHYVFLPLFLIKELGAPLKFVGIFTAALLSFNIFQFFHGWLCDRKESKIFIMLGVIISAFSLVAMTFANDLKSLLIIVLIQSFGISLWNTSAWCYMSNIGVKIKKEGQISGSFTSIAKIGAFSSYIISGLLVSFVGIRFLFLFYGLLIFFALNGSLKYFLNNERSPLF